MKMLITYIGGLISGFILFGMFIRVTPVVPGSILIVALAVGSFTFCHKVHKVKQQKYYERFKVKR